MSKHMETILRLPFFSSGFLKHGDELTVHCHGQQVQSMCCLFQIGLNFHLKTLFRFFFKTVEFIAKQGKRCKKSEKNLEKNNCIEVRAVSCCMRSVVGVLAAPRGRLTCPTHNPLFVLAHALAVFTGTKLFFFFFFLHDGSG